MPEPSSTLLYRPVGPSVTLGAGGLYALRCAVFTLGLTTFGRGRVEIGFSARETLPPLIALGAVLGLVLFLGDYRARRGTRITLGPIPLLYPLALAALMLAIAGAEGLRVWSGRPFALDHLTTIPCSLLVVLSFVERRARWPWSAPTAPPESA